LGLEEKFLTQARRKGFKEVQVETVPTIEMTALPGA